MSRFSESQFSEVTHEYANNRARRVAVYNRFLQPILDGTCGAFTLRSDAKSDRFSIPKSWNVEARKKGKKIVSYLHADRKEIILKAEKL